MCDCFHLPFPNWHASAAGEGRRLKGPEQDTDDDLVCEEPEVLEEERPRPQGSSPVEEFPTTEKYAKQAEGDFYDSPTKSSKKSKRIGFGSLFDKRSSAKMNQTEDMQSDQSEIIVKTVKEVCAEGLIVSGGKDGIFIKEVKPESPASKHLSVKEGDQILSATVYFDNVSYEDALQILEHAQPYKVAFCLKRKPLPRTQEDAETMRPDTTIGEEAEEEEEGRGPEMRGRRKTKKQHDRISWPKFPTFSKGHRANFKRSHSTSEAEEQRKLEISPPTSDTDSPLKSPLKSPDGKDKKKMHKIKIKKRMAGRRSKSVEETQENEEAHASDNVEGLDNQIIMNIVEEQVPVTNVIESPKILNEADSAKIRNEYTFPTLPATESLHKVELISVDTTLKTTDITVALEDDDKERREKSELRFSIPGKEKYEIETERQLKSSISVMRTLDPSTFDNILDSPNLMSQTELDGHQVDSDSKPIVEEVLGKTQESGKTDVTIPKVDVSLDMPEVGPISKSPKIGSDKEKKERKILETESYGIRTRGPLADIATSKSHFSNAVNRLDFTSDTFTIEIQTREDVPSTDTKKPITPTPVISQPKSHALDVDRSRKSTGGTTDIESTFKLPKVDVSEFDHQESITIKQSEPTKVPLLKREEIEIPGMEDKGSKAKVKSPRTKEQKVEKIIISKAEKKQARGETEEFNVEDVKEAVSKFPAFKLPERDITGVLVQREVTIMEMKSDKTGVTPKGSPCKIASMSTEINITLPDTMDKEKQRLSPVATKDQAFVLPKTEQLHLDEIVITESKTDQSKIKLADHQPKTGKKLARDDKISTSPDVKFKLPKREDIEIPGMEAIEQSVQPQKIKTAKDTDTKDEAVKDYTDKDIKADKSVHEKKSKKSKVSMPSFGIMTPDIRFPGIAIELPIKSSSSKSDSGTIKEMKTEAKISLEEDYIKKSSEEATFDETKKAHDIEGDQIHHDVCTAIVKETSKQDVEGELKAEIKSKDTDSSPQKMKLPKLKMPKIGGKSMKGTGEITTKEDVTVQESDITEVVLDSEKRTSETDPETDKNWSKLKMPSIDVSVPKIKIPKAEGKAKQEETGLSKPEAAEAVEDAREESGFRLIKFGISMPKEKTEEGGLLPDESEKSIIKVSGKTEVELPELPQAEIKEAESKMKKRKISFPKFGFSKSDTKVSDADITLPAAQVPLHDADGTELDVESKTTDVEAEFKESTGSPTKFKLPTIKLPKFGVSFPKTTDVGADIQMPGVSTEETTMDVKLPEAKLSVDSTALSDKKGLEITLSVSKPEVDLSLPEGKVEIKGLQKKEIKSSEEISFSKPDVDVSLTDHVAGEIPAAAFSKQDIKAAGVDVSLPQVDVSIPEGSVEIREPGVNLTISKDEAEHKDLTSGGTPVKFKLPSISLPKFGGKSSKVEKDMPVVDIDIEEPDVSFPETQICLKLKDDAPSEGQFVSVDVKVEEPKLKEQEVTVTLPKFGISLPKFEAHKPADSIDKEESIIDHKGSTAESVQAEKDPRSPTKIKLPSIKFPKFGVSFPKSTDAVSDSQMPEVTKDEPTMEIKVPETELSAGLPSLPEMKTPHIILSVSKPVVDISTPEVDKAIDARSEKKKEKVLSPDHAFPKPEVKMSLVGHGLDQETAIEGLKVQAKKLEAEVKLPSGSVDEVILEAKEKESEFKDKKRKISLPKFGFSKTDTKIPKADTSLQKEGISVPDTEIKETEVTVPAPEVEVQLKTKSTSGSPSKFKLPTISLPKFDISISKTGEESVAKAEDDAQSEIKAASAVASQDKDTGTQDTEQSKSTFETVPVDAEIKTKDTDPGTQGSRFMMRKFEFSFPKLKGPEFKKGASRTDAEKPEISLKHDKESTEGKADIPEASVETEVMMKMPKMPRSEHEFSEQDIKAPEIKVERGDASMAVGEVDVNLESDLKIQKTEMLKDDSTMGGSQIKFKLPTFKLPKFGSSSSKVKAEITDLRGEEITLETEDVFTSVEPSGIKIAFNVPSQELKKPSISVDQPKVDSGDQYTLSLTEAKTSKAEGYISLPEAKLGELSAKAEVPQATLESKIDQEVDLKDTSLKMKRPVFSLPKFGFSKPDIKAPEIDISLAQVDTSKPEGDVKIKEQSMTISVSNVEDDQKDTTLGATTKFKLPSINIPKIGGQATMEEKSIPVVDIAVKGPEVSGPDTQIKISGEAPSVDIKGPHIGTEGQTVSVDLNVEDTGLGGQEGKFKMPKFGIGLPKVKGFDLSTLKSDDITVVQEVDIKKSAITTEGMVHPPEQDSKGLDVQMKTSAEFGFSKPELKAPEVGVSIQKTDIPIPEGSMDLEEANVDIKVSDQKGSTIFGSPTKFKLPSISLPKFGVKSQKVALDVNVTDSEIEGTNIKTDISKPDVKLEVQPPITEAKVEGSADMPEVDSKGLQVKVKRPSFSFPKFGFSKPDTSTPEVNVNVPKAEVSIPEVSVTVKEQTAEVTLPGGDAEQKDLTIVSSPTKFKLPEINLPKFGAKTSKGTVSLPSADKDIKGMGITTHESDIKVSGQIPKIDLDVKEIETDIHATIRETDVHLAEGKVILPQTDVDVQDISIEGKADMPEVDLKGLDVKLKKPSFSLPKFGFSKSDIKGQDIDASQPKADMSMQEDNVPIKDVDAEITITGEVKQGDTTKFKLPSINLPKFGLKHPKATADIPAGEVDIKVPEISFPEKGEVHTTDTETNIDIKGPSVDVDIKVKEIDADGTGSKFKLPKFGIGMPTVKGIEIEGKDINMETDLLHKEKISVQQPSVEIQNVTIEGKTDTAEVDSKGLKVKLPKFGFSKPDLKAPEVDVSLPKADVGTTVGNVDVSVQSADIKLPEQEPDLKEDTFGSPTRFKLPTINFPKFGTKASKDKVDITTAHVDIKVTEASLPDKKFDMSGEVASFEMKGPTVEDPSIKINIKGDDKEQQEGKFKLPKFGIGMPKIKGIEMEGKEINIETDLLHKEKINVQQPSVEIQNVTIEGKTDTAEVDSKGLKVKLPKFGFSKPDLKAPEVDVSLPKADVGTTVGNVDVSVQSADIKLPEQEPDLKEDTFGSPTRFKLPTINFPKFGTKASKDKVDITTAHVDIKVTEVSLPDKKFDMSGEVPSVEMKGPTAEDPSIEINIKGDDKEQQEGKFKLPKFGIGMPKIKGIEMEGKEINIETDLLHKEKINVQQPSVEIQNVTIEGKTDTAEVDSKGLKVKLPKFGFSKPDLKAPEVDVSLPKADVGTTVGNVDVSMQSADIKLPEQEPDLKEDTFGSPTRFKLPTINFPKFGTKASKDKVDITTAHVDIKVTEASLPDKKFDMSGEVASFEMKGPTVEDPSIKINIKGDDKEQQEGKFKLPKFGIGMPKIKGIEMEGKEINIETDLLHKEKINVQQPSVEIQNVTIEGKTDTAEVDSKGLKVKLPKFGFSKPDLKAPEVDVSLPKADVGTAVGNVDVSVQSADIKLPEQEPDLKEDTFGSPTRFKLPTINFPKFGTKASKDKVDITTAHVDIKVTEVSLPDKKFDMSGEVASFERKGPTVEDPSIEINIKGDDKEQQEGKFKLPKFGIGMPKIKGIEMEGKEINIETDLLHKEKINVQQPSVEIQNVTIEGKTDTAEVDSKGLKVKLPKFGFSKPDLKAPEVDVSLPKADVGTTAGNVDVSVQSADIKLPEQEPDLKEDTFGSPTRFKLPTINFPKFGTKASKDKVDITTAHVDIKVTEASLPDKKFDMSGEVPSVEMKGPTVEDPSIEINIKGDDKEQKEGKFKLPKFGIGMQKIKGIEMEGKEINIETGMLHKEKINVQQPSVEIQNVTIEGKTDTAEVDSKGLKVKLPKFGFSKPDLKAPEVDVSLPKADVGTTVGNVDVSVQSADIKLPEQEPDLKEDTFGSPTRFKLPTINFPKFGTKASKDKVDITTAHVDIKVTEVSLPDKKFDMSGEVASFERKGPTVEDPSIEINIKGDDKEQQEGKFKLPKFGIGMPKIKGIEMEGKEINIETDLLHKEKINVQQPSVEIQNVTTEGKTDTVEVDSKGLKVKLPKFGFSKPDLKAPEVDVSLPKADVGTTAGNVDVSVQSADIKLPEQEPDLKEDTFGSPTRFKLPTINFPKFGTKASKDKVDITTAHVDIKVTEASLPDKKFDMSGEVPSVEMKGPTVEDPSTEINIKGDDKEQKEGKFKLPKFGIGMQKIKGIEMEGKEINIETGMLHKEKVNVQQPSAEIQNVTIEGKTDTVEVDSKGLKIKLPKFGFSKPDLKAPETDVSLPKADMGTTVGNVDVSVQSADINLPEQEPDLKEDSFGSPTRFTLPTINFPKLGAKASKDKVDITTAHVDIKVPEVSLPDKKFDMSGEVPSVEMKGPTVEDPSIEINIKGDDKEQQEGKFKLPKFGIALPTIKGPDGDQGLKKALIETEVKMSGDVLSIDKKELKLPKGSVEVDVEAKGAKLEVEESKIKLPQFGISLQASKSPEIDISVSKAEVSQTEVKESVTVKDVVVEEPADLTDMSSKGLSIKMKKPSFGFAKTGFSKSDGKAQDIQAGEMAGDITLPEGTTETGESETEGKTEITSPQFGSPTKFKLPTIKLPKFGVSIPRVPSDAPKADSETKEIKVSSVDYEIETSMVDLSGDIKGKTAETATSSIDINIKEKDLNQEGQEIKFQLPKFGISLPKVKGPEVTVTAKEAKTETPEIGITEPEIKVAAEDASLPKVDKALERSSSLETKEVETELKDDTVVSGSPSKFKLPTFKMPKFGISAQKTSDAKVKVAEVGVPDTDLNIDDKPVQVSKETKREGEIKETTEQPPEAAAKKLDGDKGSPSKFKLPSIKMPKISISRTKPQEGEDDTTTKVNAPDAKIEPKDDTQGAGKSTKFTMPTLEDVLRGFEVEFNVPTIEETEAQKDKSSVKQDQEAGAKVEEAAEHKDKGAQEKSKFKFKFPKLGFSQSSDESDKLVDAKIEESEKHLEASAEQKATVSKEQAKTEKGSWFKFSFSPTKTSKTDEKEKTQPPEEAEKLDDVEKEPSKEHEEPEKNSLSEAVEENLSPTLSLESSEAFADISSTVTTEQTGLSQTSPTKVKVKYGLSDVQSDVVTSTARCELISVEPHQPEKVNIPFSSDMSSASVDTLKQISGEIHVITSNIQAIPETQQASILTHLDAHGIHTSPLQVTLGSDSVLTVEETRVQSGTRTLVERHVVKETLHDDKETILVTQRTRVFEGDSAEPVSDETASSIRSLKDTVHIEKMSFFDSAATTEEVTIVSSETSLRHMDFSTDENGK